MSVFTQLPPWIGFVLIWLLFNAVQWALRWFFARRYSTVMGRFGLTMDWSGIEWKTTRVNKTSSSIASGGKRFWRAWFSVGAMVSIGLMLFAVGLIIYNLGHIISHILHQMLHSRSLDDRINAAASTTPSPARANLTDNANSDGFVLTPLLPGINLPLSQLGYLILALAINAFFHEAGHAIAASSEEVKVTAMGAFFRFLYPGAYVELEQQELDLRAAWQKLKITGAGVWHNTVITIVTALLIFCLPTLLSRSYVQGEGVVVVDVHQASPLAGSLFPGDVLLRLDGDCLTETGADWGRCLHAIQDEWRTGSGHCVPANQVPAETTDTAPMTRSTDGYSLLDCCDPSVANASTHLCFTHSTIPVRLDFTNYSCLPARQISESSSSRCVLDADCGALNMCLHATVENRYTRFLRIDRMGQDSVLYLGSLNDLAQALELSDFVPIGHSRVWLPNRLLLFLQYMLMVSPALAVMNAAPCVFLDGQYILTSFLAVLLPDAKYSTDRRDTLTFLILVITTFALAVMVVLSVSLQLLKWS